MDEVMIYVYVKWFWLRLFIIKEDLSYDIAIDRTQ